MKILFVVSPAFFKRNPLIGLAYLCSCAEQEADSVKVLDLNVEEALPCIEENLWDGHDFTGKYISENKGLFEKWTEEILDFEPDVVGFTLWSTTRITSMAMAEMLKKRKKDLLVVFGGPDLNFSRSLIENSHADIFIKGEGEATFLDLLREYKRKKDIEFCRGAILKKDNRITDFGCRPEIEDINELPYPNYSYFQLDKYYLKENVSISFSRGCARACTFCNIRNDWKKFRCRRAESLYQEMKFQSGKFPWKRHFDDDSPSLTQNILELDKLCDLLIKDKELDITWGGSANFEPHLTARLIEKMAIAGCRNLGFGLESGSQKVVDRMGKKFRLEDAEKIIREACKNGIEVSLNIIIGFPGETDDDFEQTLKFLKRNRGNIAFVGEPSELNILWETEISKNPAKFGVEIKPDTAAEVFWRSGSNDHALRLNRIEKFNSFLKKEGMEARHPFARVKESSGIVR